MEEIQKCNNSDEIRKLCLGATFTCPEKDSFIKLKININDIRLLMRRIYYRRKTGIEIFTSNKSYYFNFVVYNKKNDKLINLMDAQNNCKDFFSLIYKSFQTGRFSLSIKNIVIGYIDLFTENLKNNNDFFYYLFEYWEDKNNIYSIQNREVSSFDLLILINLISNRSYNDINQYPVFPLLTLCEQSESGNKIENKLYDRDLKIHIGFQGSKTRIEKVNRDYENCVIDGDKETQYYFDKQFSTYQIITNFMIRIFPYSFMNIEFQVNGFDAPGRLFYSIQETYSQITNNLGEYREFIPELYYLPEMLININRFNFGKTNKGILVNDVKLQSDFMKENKGEYYGYFKYIEDMRYKLELKQGNIYDWIILIFGENQKYKDKDPKKLLFNENSYLSFDNKPDKELDNISVDSVYLGLIPLQTIFLSKKFENITHQKCIFQNPLMDLIKSYKDYYLINLSNKEIDKSKINKEYNFQDNKKNEIKIIGNEFGKVEIYINNIYIKEYYDHKDIITYIHYNKRLNMFVTTSLDGYACIYSFPNKLLSVIKNSDNSYFDYVLLGANPFPFIFTFDKNTEKFKIYSLNGLYIVGFTALSPEDRIKYKEFKLFPLIDTNGGLYAIIFSFGDSFSYWDMPLHNGYKSK